MSEETKSGRISRREFLKDAGLIVGGATIGSIALVNACGGTTTITAPGATSTKTVTTTVPGGTKYRHHHRDLPGSNPGH